MTDDLQSIWDDYYEEHADTALRDRNLFKLESTALIEEVKAYCDQYSGDSIRLLEIGCGSGFFIEALLSSLENQHQVSVTGLDFSERAVSLARQRNLDSCDFIQGDMRTAIQALEGSYDVIISQRSIMALMDGREQQAVLEDINSRLSEEGVVVMSECYEKDLGELNHLRRQLGVGDMEKVWHSRYLEESMVQSVFSEVRYNYFASTYYLITRVVYPFFEEPEHNSPIADFAASIPQTGEFGMLKLAVCTKNS